MTSSGAKINIQFVWRLKNAEQIQVDLTTLFIFNDITRGPPATFPSCASEWTHG
jgi:hypothetical protein